MTREEVRATMLRVLGDIAPEADYSSLATPDGCVDYLLSKLQR